MNLTEYEVTRETLDALVEIGVLRFDGDKAWYTTPPEIQSAPVVEFSRYDDAAYNRYIVDHSAINHACFAHIEKRGWEFEHRSEWLVGVRKGYDVWGPSGEADTLPEAVVAAERDQAYWLNVSDGNN